MYALSGYINQSGIVTNESIDSYRGRNVIITILDSIKDNQMNSQKNEVTDKAIAAAKSLSGMWSSRCEESVDDTIRSLREVRNFGI